MIVATIFSLIRVQTRLFYNIKVMRWYHIYCCWSCCCKKSCHWDIHYAWMHEILFGNWMASGTILATTGFKHKWVDDCFIPSWKSTTTGNLLGKSPEATPRISRRLIPKWSPNMASTGFMTCDQNAYAAILAILKGVCIPHVAGNTSTVVHICTSYYRLVVWNMFYFSIPYIGNNNPNWRTHIFQRGWNHQPN